MKIAVAAGLLAGLALAAALLVLGPDGLAERAGWIAKPGQVGDKR